MYNRIYVSLLIIEVTYIYMFIYIYPTVSLQVSFSYRENGRGSCKDQLSYRCEIGYCNNIEDSKPVLTDSSSSGHDKWCQSEGQARVGTLNKSLVLKYVKMSMSSAFHFVWICAPRNRGNS